jgi:hypothetical protein
VGFLDRFMPEPPSLAAAFERGPDLTNGVRTTASVERVFITGRTESHDPTGNRGSSVVDFVFNVADETGKAGPCERRLLVNYWYIPIPGTVVPVVYLPGRFAETLDLVRNDRDNPVIDEWILPDPAVPRGWSGGYFDVEGLGSEGTWPLSGHGIEQERELFRTGRQVEAEIIRAKQSWLTRRESFRQTVTLRVEGRELEVKPWTPVHAPPQPGDRIKVAFGDDEHAPALDTDERWNGLPGRVLAMTTPPEVLAARSPEAVVERARQAAGTQLPPQRVDEATVRQLEALEYAHDKGTITDDQFEEMSARTMERARQAGEQRRPPEMNEAKRRQLESLEKARDKGQITNEQLEEMKARLGIPP